MKLKILLILLWVVVLCLSAFYLYKLFEPSILIWWWQNFQQ
jgi:hypothetical protein